MCEKYSYKICDDGLEESIDILGADEEIFVPNDIITEQNVGKIINLLNKQDTEIKSQAKIIQELEKENMMMKKAFKRKFDYDIEDVVDEICDEDW